MTQGDEEILRVVAVSHGDERERERERGFLSPFCCTTPILWIFLFFSLSSGKLSQWTTMTKESSFVAVIHYDEGKFIRHSETVQQRKNPSSRWTPVTKKNSNVTMSHCGKGILFVAVNQCNEGKLLCNSEPLWQKIFFLSGWTTATKENSK